MAYIGRQPSYGAFETQNLTADSSTTTFTLNYTVGSTASVLVSVAGVIQQPNAGYSLSGGGNNIVFSAAPTTGDTVFVTFLGLIRDVGSFLNSGIITTQTATTDSASADLFLTYDDSASALRKITNTNLTKTLDISGQTELSALAADDDVLLIYDTSASAIKKIQKSNIAATLSYVTRNATGDGSTSTVTVTNGTAVDNVLVFENGVLQKPTTDYQISGTTLTFQGGAPASGVAIQIRELPR